jgi:hypothetical protein
VKLATIRTASGSAAVRVEDDGADLDFPLPTVSDQVDWQGELGLVIASPVRRASAAEAVTTIYGLGQLSNPAWPNAGPGERRAAVGHRGQLGRGGPAARCLPGPSMNGEVWRRRSA